MAKPIECTLVYKKAEKTDGGWSYFPMDEPVRKDPVTLASLADLAPKVKAAVAEIGHHCSVYALLPRGIRRPNGWDKATHAIQFVPYQGPPF